jgi:ribosomal protein S18 acetylase RimI-like enzyme
VSRPAKNFINEKISLAMTEIRQFQNGDEQSLIQLWRDCDLVRAQNNPQKDIERKRKVQPDLFLVGLAEGCIIASVMAGYDGHRGWLNYLAVAPAFQNRGIARKMIQAAEKGLSRYGCPKVNIQVRLTNSGAIEFYKKIGFQVDEVASLGMRLVKD